ncbi:hypothetical protein FOFC_08959 [Fusarium oxysporum]|nr:hypothetical protein FOFC_08959 [Fusarium oxysporum]
MTVLLLSTDDTYQIVRNGTHSSLNAAALISYIGRQ